jgi:putative transcriptional regulator
MPMDDALFADLQASLDHLKRHARGEVVPGVQVHEVPEVEPRAVREALGVSQSEFARLLSVPPRTVQNWEQHRTRPTGPARALLRMIQADPSTCARLLMAGAGRVVSRTG